MDRYGETREALNDSHNGCVPIALAPVTGMDVNTVDAQLKASGRRADRQGVYQKDWRAYMSEQGFHLEDVTRKYLGAVGAGLTVRKTAERPDPGRRFILTCSRHVAAFVEGTLEDFTSTSNHRVKKVFEVSRQGERAVSDFNPPARTAAAARYLERDATCHYLRSALKGRPGVSVAPEGAWAVISMYTCWGGRVRLLVKTRKGGRYQIAIAPDAHEHERRVMQYPGARAMKSYVTAEVSHDELFAFIASTN